MRKETSIYLDAVRFLAALTVFIGHVSGRRLTGGFLWHVSAFMDISVIIFFVLSGFVIAFVLDTKERTASEYAINRVARIYSVALPALLLTFTLDSIGRHLRPELYNASWGFSSQHVWWQYLSGFTFTNQLWWTETNPGSLMPYWSLGYEVWYYAIFGAFWFARGYLRYILIIVFALIAGPKILSLFPIWIAGFVVYHIGLRNPLATRTAWSGLAVTLFVFLVLVVLTTRLGLKIPRTIPVRYAIAIWFSLNVLAVQVISKHFGPILQYTSRPIRWLAAMTFSLYLFHVPIAQFFSAIVPWPPSAVATRATMLLGTFVCVTLLAEVTERRKGQWRRVVRAIFAFAERLQLRRITKAAQRVNASLDN
jgi:peptidoglycan/LPS O-acetylase OafA/YrhL